MFLWDGKETKVLIKVNIRQSGNPRDNQDPKSAFVWGCLQTHSGFCNQHPSSAICRHKKQNCEKDVCEKGMRFLFKCWLPKEMGTLVTKPISASQCRQRIYKEGEAKQNKEVKSWEGEGEEGEGRGQAGGRRD